MRAGLKIDQEDAFKRCVCCMILQEIKSQEASAVQAHPACYKLEQLGLPDALAVGDVLAGLFQKLLVCSGMPVKSGACAQQGC